MAETSRHNWASETETNRHNLAFEAETNRHNVRTEAQTDLSLAETARHNLSTETETARHNLSTERETQRSNRVDEGERRRHNKVSEKIDKSRNSETARANKAKERIESKKIKESKRHNVADEGISRSKVASDIALNASKTAAQDWINQWRVDNPTLATMEQAGLKAKDIGIVLASQGTKTITNKTLPEVADDFKHKVKSGVNDYVGWWTYLISKPSVSAEDWAGDFDSYWTIIKESSNWKKLDPDAKVRSAAKKAAKSVWDKTHK